LRECEEGFLYQIYTKILDLGCDMVETREKKFAVGVVMLSYLAGKALIYREPFCEWVPFCILRMTTGARSQHIEKIDQNM